MDDHRATVLGRKERKLTRVKPEMSTRCQIRLVCEEKYLVPIWVVFKFTVNWVSFGSGGGDFEGSAGGERTRRKLLRSRDVGTVWFYNP